ncbi:hypothetical protein LZ32DRAFT_323366 [Colletotrichum eremochloae]|nr:hypothetical protein LZ32DRAFT_323366 [Colletotrichum eremochloae]
MQRRGIGKEWMKKCSKNKKMKTERRMGTRNGGRGRRRTRRKRGWMKSINQSTAGFCLLCILTVVHYRPSASLGIRPNPHQKVHPPSSSSICILSYPVLSCPAPVPLCSCFCC